MGSRGSAAYLLEEQLLLVGREGAAAREDHVEEHAEAPQVGALAVGCAVVVVVVPREHLGRDVVGRAAEPRELPVGLPEPRVPEVDELHVAAICADEEDVLGLDVSVHDVERVQVVDGEKDLCKEVCRLRLRVAALLDDAVEELRNNGPGGRRVSWQRRRGFDAQPRASPPDSSSMTM